MDNAQIKDQVRERYADIARRALKGNQSGCDSSASSSDCCSSSKAIPLDAIATHVAGQPEQVVETTLGCGTPLEIANVQPGETVLDLGSGGGLDCFLAAKKAGPGGRAIGVDMTPEMIALAKENAAKVGATNVEFRQGFLEQLPVEDGTVDVIISNCVVNLSPDKDSVFREAFRVLKPGGRVAISDMVSRVTLPQIVRANIASWASCVAGAITEKEYIAKMEAAGFVDVKNVAGHGGFELVYSAKIVGRKK